MQKLEYKKEIVNFFLKKGILLSSDILEKLQDNTAANDVYSILKEKVNENELAVIFDELVECIKRNQKLDVNWQELEKTKVFEEKSSTKLVEKFVGYIDAESIKKSKEDVDVKVIFSYEEDSKPREIEDFVKHYNVRYQSIKSILDNRRELQNIMSINRIISKKDREHISLIGMVKDKSTTKNHNIILVVEDPTGFIKVIINKNKPELHELAKSIVFDEVLGITGVNGDNVIFANNIIWPDVPVTKEQKKSPLEQYAIFLSDMHVGSTKFLRDDFNKFLKWLKGDIGNNIQKEISKKIRYLFIVGDLVDGVGIYPGQEDELEIKDIYLQYRECAELIAQIPPYINIIICPGNHDAMHIAEPQPKLYKDFAEFIYKIPNATLVSNPSIVNIGSTENFPGLDVLLYHGYSFDYYVAEVDSIRSSGGYDRADLIMKYLLKRRHLAPSHGSNLYIPDIKKDYLTIDKIPDIFITGHIHKSSVSTYRNITLISGSCWQSKTQFQEKVGHNPEPGRVPIVNLNTREVKILKFSKEN